MKLASCAPILVTLVLSLLPGVLQAQQPPAATPSQPPGQTTPSTTQQPPLVKPGQPPKNTPPAPPEAAQPDAASFARANEAVASAPRSLTPGVFGDQFGGNRLGVFAFNQATMKPTILNDVVATSPSDLVGRFKVAENNSPIPGDRAYFNYNFFSSTVYGVDVSRFTAGVEKTFFDGLASVELRLPFASTLDNQQVGTNGAAFITTSGTSTRLGDLQIVTKFLVARSDTLSLGAGVGVAVPTAPDFRVIASNVRNGNNDGFLQIGNEAVYLQPYLSFLYAPDDRFYAQGFSSIDIDLNGNSVQLNTLNNTSGLPLNQIGHLRDRTFYSTDLAVGYWIYRNNNAWLTGLAPQLEVHWNQALDKVSTVASQVGGILGDSHVYSNVNLGTILNLEFRNSSHLALGLVFPVSGNNNRDFSVEFGVLFNYHF